jgi:hypothetical protein
MKNIKFHQGDYAIVRATGEVVRVANPDLEKSIVLGSRVNVLRERVKTAIEHSSTSQAQGSNHYSWVWQSKLKAHKLTDEQLKEWQA